MTNINVSRLSDKTYAVSLDTYKYKVTLSEDYWQSLTGGKVAPEELVKTSFEFLLEREGPESILPEFDLPLISKYFPEYEATIAKSL